MQIKTEQFEGPLDLLLQLTEEQQLDVSTLSLAKVTEQFLAYVKNLQEKNPINLADFLVIAAKLLVIKSKSLLPNLDLGTEEEEAAFDLTEQLLLYKKFKEVSRFLKKLDLKRHQSWARDVDFSDRVTFVPDPDTDLPKLAEGLRKLASELKDIIKLPKEVMKEVVSISEKITHIQQLISDKVQTSLSSLIKDAKTKTEVIVTFIKQKVLTVEQDQMFEDITIKKA
jgi:segregation and condensation protein A